MSDKEIIKALECCNDGACEYCPIGGSDCIQRSRNEAIDLINRQQAEIERLHKAIKVQDIMIEQQDYKLKTAKSEAIKEFAERLTDRADLLKTSGLDYRWAIWQDDIDNLVKEMTEECENG